MFEKIVEMKANYPSIKLPGEQIFYDFGLVDELQTTADMELRDVLDKGYGVYGSCARMKVELRRALERNPGGFDKVCAAFCDPDGRRYYCTAQCCKTIVYRGCKLLYSLVEATVLCFEAYDKAEKEILVRRWHRDHKTPEGTVFSQNGTVDKVTL